MSSSLARETQWYSVSKDDTDKIKTRVVKVLLSTQSFNNCNGAAVVGDSLKLETRLILNLWRAYNLESESTGLSHTPSLQPGIEHGQRLLGMYMPIE